MLLAEEGVRNMPIELEGLTLYTVDELAEKLDVSENTLREYIRYGKLKGRKLGTKWFVSAESLWEYFNSDVYIVPNATPSEDEESSPE